MMKTTMYKIEKYSGKSKIRLPMKLFKTRGMAYNYGIMKFGKKSYRTPAGWGIKSIVKRITTASKTSRRKPVHKAKSGFSLMNPYTKLAKEGRKSPVRR